MSKIWYCPNCGYEVNSRGRCHLCRSRLVASDLPELATGDEDDEVGYRLDDWVDRDRGRLIEGLNELEVLHRFEDDELVVTADDEARVDDLIAEVAASPGPDQLGGDGTGASIGSDDEAKDEEAEWIVSALRQLADAAHRLRQDPTDMHADADVAEASAAVFTVDGFSGVDPDTWAAVGRVTRRLLSALGDDEALEDEIRTQAGVLYKLLDPLVEQPEAGPDGTDGAEEAETAEVPGAEESGAKESGAEADDNLDQVAKDVAGEDADDGEGEGDGDDDDLDDDDDATDEAATDGGDTETIYELPDWLPEQRAQLGMLLDDAEIAYEWEDDDLVVPADRETEVESLFVQVSGPTEDADDDEDRYHAIEELFAVADRLTNDPSDEHRAAEAVARVQDVAGPPPLGLDEVAWFRIMTQARLLSETIEADREDSAVAQEARSLRDLLRGIV